MSKAMKGIVIIKKLNKALPQHFRITILKSFVRLHLDYADIIYDQPIRKVSIKKMERIQYNAALAIKGMYQRCHQRNLSE